MILRTGKENNIIAELVVEIELLCTMDFCYNEQFVLMKHKIYKMY